MTSACWLRHLRRMARQGQPESGSGWKGVCVGLLYMSARVCGGGYLGDEAFRMHLPGTDQILRCIMKALGLETGIMIYN